MSTLKNSIIILFILLSLTFSSVAGIPPTDGVEDFDNIDTDVPGDTLVYVFDLRERESFLQLTYNSFNAESGDDDDDDFTPGQNLTVHIQIFNVVTDCIENDFFDVYTPNDTHVYNMRDIQTNDGNPSGVVLPEGAYGFVFAFAVDESGNLNDDSNVFIGNSRILDNNGYEYRTNAVAEPTDFEQIIPNDSDERGYFNYNTRGDVTLSDIVGVVFDDSEEEPEVDVTPLDNFAVINVDLYDLNENPFSCRNIIYACISPDSPLQDALLEKAAEFATGSASVARAEYGINDAIPHSKGGELLCPGNNISEGFATLEILNFTFESDDDIDTLDDIVIWIGLNNGNGRGSMDTVFYSSDVEPFEPFPPSV